MKITLLQENLLKAVQQSARFISGRPQIPILAGIKFAVTDSKLTLMTTDLRVGFQTNLTIKMDEAGEVVVPAKILTELLNTLSPGAVELKTDGDQLLVSQKKTKVKIPTFPPAEFPPFPEASGEEYEFSTKQFTEAIQSSLYTASLDETRPVLASLLFKIEDGELLTVCTDGYRLTVAKTKLDNTEVKNLSLLLPARSMQELLAVTERSGTKKVVLSVSQELSQTFVTVNDFVVLIRMVEGEFPPYERIIPESFSFETLLDREEWLGALKTAMVFARESSQVVTMEFNNQSCRILSASNSAGEQEGEIESTGKTTEPKKIAFNGKFLLDVLQHLSSDKVIFKMNDELKPGVILPEDKNYPLSVIMPFKR